MNDTLQDANEGAVGVLDACAVRAFHDRLDGPVTDGDLLAELRACEELKNALAARQARLTVAVHDNQTAGETTTSIGTLTATSRPPAPPGMPPPTTSYIERTLIDATWTFYAASADQGDSS